MALTRLARSSSSIDPLLQLGKVISDLLPHQGLPLIEKARRWSDRLLVLGALLMCWAGGTSLGERFNLARACLIELYPTRKRPGTGYNGFIDCLARHSERLLKLLTDVYRRRMVEMAGADYRTFGFIVFGVDGTKIQLPRSDSNLARFGVANKKHAGPEMLLCGLFHVATQSLWAFTNVLDTDRLSDKQIVQLYAMRWRIEVSYRWLKTSLNGRKMLSTSADHAGLEMDWTLMSLWTLTLISLAQGVEGNELSLAGMLRLVREAMTHRRIAGRRRLTARLRRMRRDSYRRRSCKSKRHWPRRARVHRCGTPLARMANAEEITLFQRISAHAT